MTKKLKTNKILKYAKKIKAINLLGGKCECCGENRIFRLEFHHKNKDEKIFNLRDIGDMRWEDSEQEILKCQLLCRNCHRELHFNENKTNNRFKNNKKIYLEYTNKFKCEKCGYNKCNGSLDFHHRPDSIKNFDIGKCAETLKNVEDIRKDIIEELDKCDILCANCHGEIHSDNIFFEEYKKEIYEKSKNMRKRMKIDGELVRKLYFEDSIKINNISKILNCSKTGVFDIIKKIKNKQKNI